MNERGRYELLDRIAQGGMAELYRARAVGEQGVTKLLAIKRIRPELASNQAFVKMMFEEARLAADLSHPNIVQVYELGRDAGGCFIAMELVSGPSLATLLRRLAAQGRSLPEPCTLDVVIQLLRALDYAHRKTDLEGRPLHLVHRDVSPENLLLTTSGAVKLTDFGIAKARNSPQQTLVGALKGKPRYMSPEQACGAPLDGRSDLFSAGLVLWECLTGRPRFDATNDLALLAQVAENRWTAPAALGLQLAPALESALARVLASAPEARFESAADFARELAGHHHRAWPDYVPETLGALVKELYGADLELLDAGAGGEQPAGQLGVTGPEAFFPRPAEDASKVPTVPDRANDRTGTEPATEPLAQVRAPDAAAAGSATTEPATGPAAAGSASNGEAAPEPAMADFAREDAPVTPRAADASRAPARAPALTCEQRQRAAQEAQINQAIAEANATELAARKASRKTPLPVLFGVFLSVAALSGGLLTLLDRLTSVTPPHEQPAAALPPSAGGAAAPSPAAKEITAKPAKATTARKADADAPAGPAASGFLSLTCEPDCEVLLRGKLIGHSPLTGYELPAGRHRVLVRNRLANLSKTLTVEVEPNLTTSRQINLVLDP